MNIFALDNDPKTCAIYHTDKHVVKMIVESAQMLSTAVRVSGIDAGYKITHVNHPCSIWVRKSLSNYNWLKDLVSELHNEWKFRYNHPDDKIHKSFSIVTELPTPNIDDIGLTNFALAMPDEFKVDDPIESYRNYYRGAKQHLHHWKKRSVPNWIND